MTKEETIRGLAENPDLIPPTLKLLSCRGHYILTYNTWSGMYTLFQAGQCANHKFTLIKILDPDKLKELILDFAYEIEKNSEFFKSEFWKGNFYNEVEAEKKQNE